jgi:hypothetical protein
MSRRAIIAVALLIIAVIVEAFAYFVTHDHVFVWVAFTASERLSCGDHGGLMDPLRVSDWWSFFATLAAGGVALRIGPRLTATLGALIAAAGVVLIACNAWLLSGAMLVAVGIAVFRPCLLAASAELMSEEALGRQRFLALGAMAMLSGAAYDTARLFAVHGVRALMKHASGGAVIVIAAALFMVVAALCASADVIARNATSPATVSGPETTYRGRVDPAADALPSARGSHGLGIVALLAPIMLAVCIAYTLEVPYGARVHGGASSVHLIARSLVAPVFSVGAIVAIRRRVTWPPIAAFAIALVIYGVGLFPALLTSGRDVILSGPFLASALLCSLATPLMNGVSLAYVALAPRLRYATLTLAAWTVVLEALTYPVLRRAWWIGRPGLIVLIAAGCIAAGLGIGRVSRDLHRSLFERKDGV